MEKNFYNVGNIYGVYTAWDEWDARNHWEMTLEDLTQIGGVLISNERYGGASGGGLMCIPDDLLAPYGPIWPIDPDRDLYEWDQRFGPSPDNIAEYIAECIAEEWRLVA